VEQLEALVHEAEETARVSPLRAERTREVILEWGRFRKISNDVIAYHRGHVTETTRILNLVARMQKAFSEIYSSRNQRDKEWFEGTFPKFRPALDELTAYIKRHQ
jgi:hypothetical protein